MRTSLTVAVAAGLALAGCRSPLPPASDPASIRAQICAQTPGVVECLHAVEQHFLADAPAGVERAGETLVVHPSSGSPIELTDSPPSAEAAEVTLYGYAGFLPEVPAHLVQVQHYEGSNYLLIDLDGKATDLDDLPVLSPDRNRFVTASGGAYAEDRVEIWLITPHGVAQEFSFSPCSWSPAEARWLSEREIEVTKTLVVPGSTDDEPSSAAQPAHLRLEDDGWWVYDKTR